MAITRVVDRLLTLLLLLLASSTLCNAALPEFVADTAEHRQMIQTAFEDAVKFARTVALAWMPTCEPYVDRYYDRYFDPADEEFVKHMFRTLADIPLDLDLLTLSPDDVRLFMDSLTADRLNDDFSGLSISYGNHPSLPPAPANAPFGCDLPRVNGFLDFNPDDPSHATMSLCPRLFEKYYSLLVIDPPPDALTQQGIEGLGCDGLGNTETNYMWTPGATFLHELFHWSYLFEDVPDWHVNIRRSPTIDVSWIDDYPSTMRPDITDDNPPTGYGAFHAQQVRRLPDDEDDGYIEAVNNADNYACYASSRTWGLICNRNFAAPADQDAWLQREDPPEQQAAKVAARQGDQGGPVGCVVNSESKRLECY